MILLLQPLGNSVFAQIYTQEELDKERIQLEKQRKIFEENMLTIESQINELSSILNTLKNNDVEQDKIEDIEEQLAELYDDKQKLEEAGFDLSERESIFKEKWNKYSATADVEATSSESSPIPNWFKSNAKWWKEGLISDADIVNALENLIIQDVIPLDNFVKSSSGLEHAAGVPKGGTFVLTNNDEPKIPSFQKDVFGFWSDGLVSDDEIVNSIGHLMGEGIINSEKIQTEISERQSKIEQKSERDSFYMDSVDDESIVNAEVNSDGSKTITFDDGSTTTFYKDGSRSTTYTDAINNAPGTFIDDFHDSMRDYDDITPFREQTSIRERFDAGMHTASDGSTQYFIIDNETGKTTWISDELYEIYLDSKEGLIFIDSDGQETKYEIDDNDEENTEFTLTDYFGNIMFADELNKFAEDQYLQDLEEDPGQVVAEDYETDLDFAPIGQQSQLIQVTALSIDGVYYPISQFALWKWTGECDDTWHYHTPTTQAISADGETGIIDPDIDNCGFGIAGQVFVGTAFMSQDQIDKFRDRTGTDPLSNEAMIGGSDTGSDPVSQGPTTPPVYQSADDLPFVDLEPEDIELDSFVDSDGDGLADNIDLEPNKKSKKFNNPEGTLPGEILDDGGNPIQIMYDEDGYITIIVGGESYSKPAIIELFGIEIELEPGTIVEASFG